ncbi:PAS domain S-box protein [Rhodocaloribacter litoris]|uniref:PAS domain S-box protein n=1 Tax=Rhodocaloribacter litoris TaxID=2558931 RepID=UPI001E5A5E4A|nr:PAS domain S-box protein [Rhodocaloribacter litoris]
MSEQLQDASRSVADRLRVVSAAAAGVIGARSREALRSVLEEACRQVLPSDAFMLLGYDAATHTFQDFAGRDATPAAGTPGERVVHERRSVLVHRTDDAGAPDGPLSGIGYPFGSAIHTPVLAGDEVLGVLAVHSFTPDRYTDADVGVVEVLASLAATALVNMRLAESRQEAMEALRERERQLSEAERLARLGSWRWTIGSDHVIWSDELFRIYGLPPNKGRIAFSVFIAHLHPEDRARVLARIEEARRGGKPYDFLHRIVRPDGTVRVLHARGAVVHGPDGRPHQMIGTGQDVTDLTAAEAALRASEESYRTIFELASDAIFVHDLETGAILDANRKACELHGCTLDELKALGVGGISDGRPPFDAGHAWDRIRRAAGGEPQRFEWLVRRKTDERFWVEVSLHRVRIRGEDRILASVRNIDERKQAEAALKRAYEELEQRVAARTAELAERTAALEQAEQRFRAIVEASPTPLLLSRLDDGVILYANDRLETLIGAEPGSLVGKKTPDFYTDPADRPRVLETVRRQGYVRDLELCIRRADGSPCWVSLSAQRLVFDGAPTVATALIDITERKQAEAALRASEASYRSLFDNLTELVYVQDLDGRFLNVNEAVVQAYGYRRDEIIGQTPALLAASDRVDVEETMRCFRLAVAGEPQRFDWWGRRKDGSCFPKTAVASRKRWCSSARPTSARTWSSPSPATSRIGWRPKPRCGAAKSTSGGSSRMPRT